MFKNIEIIKGLHPGLFLERELSKKRLSKGRFAISIDEYPQTLGSITKGKRKMNISLALKIEKALGLEEGFLMAMQVFYDIEKEKKKLNKKPNLKIFRKALFWDTQIDKIDWEKQKKAVISRVFNRGNEEEKKETIRFYGKEVIEKVLANG